MESKEILGVRVDFGLRVPDVLKKIDEFVSTPGSHSLFTVNPEFIMKAQKDKELEVVLNASDLSVPDGAGVLFAKKYMDKVGDLPRDFLFPAKAFIYGSLMGFGSVFGSKTFGSEEKLAGADMIFDICQHAERNGYTIYLLGGWEKDASGRMKSHHGNIADKAAERLKTLFPRLKIVGATSEFSKNEPQDAATVEYMKNDMTKGGVDHIDIVFVGFTSGDQEKWISRNLAKIPAKVGIGIGASFDFITETYERAPKALRGRNLEWLHRLMLQPWRIKRIFMSFPTFPFLVYLESVKSFRQK